MEIKAIVELSLSKAVADGTKLQARDWHKIYYKLNNGLISYTSSKSGNQVFVNVIEHSVGHYEHSLRNIDPKILIGPEEGYELLY
jgi:hypothetical protein